MLLQGTSINIFQIQSNIRFLKYNQVVNEPTDICRSQIDHVFIKKVLLEQFHTEGIIQNKYFSNHDAVTTVFQNNEVDFTVSK